MTTIIRRIFGTPRPPLTTDAPQALVPTHGPWATHAPGCHCNICR